MKKALALFTQYWRPLGFHKRDREFYTRHAAGDISSRDIIEIEYGGAMPNGWNVKDKPHQHAPVQIMTPLTDKRQSWFSRIIMSLMTLGYVHRDTPRDVKDIERGTYPGKAALALNKLIFSPLGQGGMLYLITGLVTTLAPLVAAANPVALVRRYPLLALMAVSSLRNQPLTQILTLPFRPSMDTVGHENIHVLQNRDPYETKTGHNIFRNSFKNKFNEAAAGGTLRSIDSFVSLGMASYFRNDYEIQARMNTLLTHNYARWGRMPQTRHEFYAAMIDAGLRVSPYVNIEIETSTEDLSAFQKRGTIGRWAAQLFSPHIAELNTAYWGLYSEQSRHEYWRDAMPYMYGHLTELCGDESGLARMGYSGPVTADGTPVPLSGEEREKFWAGLDGKGDLMDKAMVIKDIEAQRGMILRDHFNDAAINDIMQSVEKYSPHVTALRKSMHGGTGYTAPRAP